MAKTRTRKRRRKHRGTQAGSLDRRGRTSRPRSRQEARARARSKVSRGEVPPSWRSATYRGVVAAALFFIVLAVLFKQPIAGAAGIAIFMLAFYIPLGYLTDRFFYDRRRRKLEREREEGRAAKS